MLLADETAVALEHDALLGRFGAAFNYNRNGEDKLGGVSENDRSWYYRFRFYAAFNVAPNIVILPEQNK